jgi:hypothetical protein
MAKKAKALKVSEETGVSVEDLQRLPIDALDKLDVLTPDGDLLEGSPADKKLIGYHPVTGAEIWK